MVAPYSEGLVSLTATSFRLLVHVSIASDATLAPELTADACCKLPRLFRVMAPTRNLVVECAGKHENYVLPSPSRCIFCAYYVWATLVGTHCSTVDCKTTMSSEFNLVCNRGTRDGITNLVSQTFCRGAPAGSLSVFSPRVNPGTMPFNTGAGRGCFHELFHLDCCSHLQVACFIILQRVSLDSR